MDKSTFFTELLELREMVGLEHPDETKARIDAMLGKPQPSCRNCKHWTLPKSKEAGPYGICTRLHSDHEPMRDKDVLPAGAVAYAQDVDEYKAFLLCEPHFFCGLFAEKAGE